MKSSASFLSKIGLTAGALIAAVALSALAQTSGWTSAPATPPNGNVAAPINVSLSAQAKTGLLGLSALQFNPGGASNIATGSVMTASDQFGDVGWSPAASGGGATVNQGGSTSNYYVQIGSDVYLEGGIIFPGTNPVNVTFAKPFAQVISVVTEPLDTSGSTIISPEEDVRVYNITNTGFSYGMGNQNGFSWMAMGTVSSHPTVTPPYVPPDSTPPSVTLTSPVSNQSYSNPVTLSANASDNVAVAGVQFLVCQGALSACSNQSQFSLIGNGWITSSPYTMTWTAPTVGGGLKSTYTIEAEAEDTSGNTSFSNMASHINVTQ